MFWLHTNVCFQFCLASKAMERVFKKKTYKLWVLVWNIESSNWIQDIGHLPHVNVQPFVDVSTCYWTLVYTREYLFKQFQMWYILKVVYDTVTRDFKLQNIKLLLNCRIKNRRAGLHCKNLNLSTLPGLHVLEA